MARIVVLTGAGISAESGLGTFRDENGLWSQYDLEEVATPQGFRRNPSLVHDFYNARRRNCAEARPNAAHTALARLEAALPGQTLIVTQNVDDLHHRAGSRNVIQMHGALMRARCGACNRVWPAPMHMAPDDPCPACRRAATRPDVVWFGEIPYHMDRIAAELADCRVFAAIGTSGQVWPAAGLVMEARAAGAHCTEINTTQTDVSGDFDAHLLGLASRVVPDWVAWALARADPGAAGG
ncbi:NAD-dependent deacylase [Pararhodobacter sp. SW119]|uniref:NAD-dependent deacylase n=1 Tax=Pararhodobacter sp. SW119 TaxID=2780075 RepID=UPI001AE00BA7|nr:NAD-dependent deacylase [Pararhodobacter sp. SW119]